MYQYILDSAQFEIFRSLPDALRWLRLDFTAVDGIVHRNAAHTSFALTARTVELSIPLTAAPDRRLSGDHAPAATSHRRRRTLS